MDFVSDPRRQPFSMSNLLDLVARLREGQPQASSATDQLQQVLARDARLPRSGGLIGSAYARYMADPGAGSGAPASAAGVVAPAAFGPQASGVEREQPVVDPAQAYEVAGPVKGRPPARERPRVTPGARVMLDGIAGAEGADEATARRRGYGSGYDVVYGYKRTDKPLSAMTYDEVMQLQKQGIKGPVGRYQFQPTTLQEFRDAYGLKGDEIFDKDLQDQIALMKMQKRGWGKPGATVDELQRQFAREWASIAEPETDQSHYAMPKKHGRPVLDAHGRPVRQPSPLKTADFRRLFAQSQAADDGR